MILLLAAAALGAGLGLRDPTPPDEPRFALAARTMVETGDWLLPRRGSELYTHKPPMFMWLQAVALKLTGNLRIAFLLPSLLAGLATLWLTWDLTRRLWNRRVAAFAALALLATLQFALQARRGQIDMVLTAFTTLALWALLRHLLLERDWRLAALAGFAAGLGTVTKGVGFLPLLAFIPWLLMPTAARQPVHAGTGRVAPGVMPWMVLAGFVAGAATWLGPLLWRLLHDADPALRAYADDLLLRQTATRYANPWHHRQPAWYFLQVIVTLWLPGALLLPWLLPAWWRRLRRRERRQWMLLGWGLLVLLFFTLSPGKRDVYILPALPAFCLAAAPLLPGLLRRASVRRVLFGHVLAMSAGLLVLGIAGLSGLGGLDLRLAAERGLATADAARLFAWLVAAGIGGLLLAAWRRPRRAGSAAVLFMAMLVVIHGIGLAPALDASSSARMLMQEVGRRIGPDAELSLLGWREQQMLQADRPVMDFGFSRPLQAQWLDAAPWLANAPERRWLLLPAEDLDDCMVAGQTVAAGRSNRVDWILVPGTALRTGCVPAQAPAGRPH